MKRIITLAIAVVSALQLSLASSFDLSSSSASGIYKMEVGGTPEEGILDRVSVTLPEYKRAVLFASPQKDFYSINQLQPWQSTDIHSIYTSDRIKSKPQNCVFFIAFELADGEYLTIQPISAERVMSWIEVQGKSEIDVVCGTMGTGEISNEEAPIFAYTRSSNLYEAIYTQWSDLLDCEQVEGHTNWRDNKEYSEIYKYLGWCSWEQYRKNIDEELLVSAIDEIERSEIPVRWVLIDDGHQTEEGVALINFEISQDKFPNGWGPIIDKRSDKIKWFGLWHCMYGLWAGISPNHTMDDLAEYMAPSRRKKMILGESPVGSKIFYEMLVNSVADPGFDFTKIDVQAGDFSNYIGGVNPVVAHRQNAENLEAETHAKLNGLMNCMAQSLPCIFNTRYSATTRVSVDYRLNNIPMARSHIYQSFQNSIWMGQTIWPDHDMFHSSDVKLGRFMAVSKAISAAPIYLSDAPKDFIPEYITPLAYEDGELLRPLAPGVPLPESFFADALLGDQSYSVIAPMTPRSAAIVAYHVADEGVESAGVTITEQDYTYADGMVQPYPGMRVLPKEGLVYYDWYNKSGGKLNGSYSFDLDVVEDRIVLLVEIENGWSVIGLEDKYLSTVAVKSQSTTKKSIEVELQEAGTILVYSKKPIKSSTSGEIEHIGGDIYRITATKCKVTLGR